MLPRILTVAFFCITSLTVNTAAAQDFQSFFQQGQTALRSGAFERADSCFARAYPFDSTSTGLMREWALTQWYLKDYARGIQLIQPWCQKDTVDEQLLRVAVMLYKGNQQHQEAERLLKQATEKYPKNGAFYHDYGELLSASNDARCISQWEKGIAYDPGFPDNYYQACLFYTNRHQWLWAALYGEIYINLDPLNTKSSRIRELMLRSYRELFAEIVADSLSVPENDFTGLVVGNYKKQISRLRSAMPTSLITMIRARFVVDWFVQTGNKFPFSLFDWQRQLMREGHFEAYNQWIFGVAENMNVFQRWLSLNRESYSDFLRFQRQQVFQVPPGQYYR
jgi:tetratricopeptide (TPR) repeat protein